MLNTTHYVFDIRATQCATLENETLNAILVSPQSYIVVILTFTKREVWPSKSRRDPRVVRHCHMAAEGYDAHFVGLLCDRLLCPVCQRENLGLRTVITSSVLNA